MMKSSILRSKIAEEMKSFSFLTTLLPTLLALQSTVIPHANEPASLPVAPTLESWIARNMKEHQERKANIANGFNRTVLDQLLVKADDGSVKVIKVKKNGSGDFDTVTAAVDSIPLENMKRLVVWIGGGEYFEKITINRTKNFVTFYGDPMDMPKIVFNGTAADFGTVNSATVAVESDYFMAVNIAFVNSAPMADGQKVGAQAVAMRISGDKAAFYNCKFIGFQDTLCDDKGMHFFKDCYIEGTVDFIFGNGKSLYLNTTIQSVAKNLGVITAQAREKVGDDSGFTFLYCNITGGGNSTTYLGRAWKQRPRVIFAFTYMGTVINSKGWSTDKHPERNQTVYYGEYKCKGPGASSSGRVGFAKILSELEAKPFMSLTYIRGSNWLLPPPSL
ncbi:putative pectinesterase 63 [Durio zibethinus]|uniref:Pectinesterase n=1 Tax=Durio zibethinus TaxID=66656 RepID=A0A6P5XL51_DURZI|nr:putative pectinesterase 63 [Durio zibethinus]